MGVPTFFRWVSEKYPKIVQKCVEEDPAVFADGTEMPVDATQPNPNGMEFDNLYLDMNGIIHPCTHPENGEEPPTMELMFAAIGKHIERLFRMIRPRKLLYMAIDGIAPRAKMNQQRSRRFRSALEADEIRADKERVLRTMKAKGLRVPDKEGNEPFDSNVITPGTEFMDKLAEYLRGFIIERQANDAAWARCKVILSDAQSPGEGEHKIMQFVRRQRAEAGHDPDTHHVMYGLDADLIMLGLASHEVRFTVLRDQVFFGKQNRKAGAKADQVLQQTQSQQQGEATAAAEEDPLVTRGQSISISKLKPIEMLHVWILREYLQHEFRPESFGAPLPFPYDFERCIDDFVFLCFFVGNDFLPHLPSLSIREGGLELLINLYRKVLPTLTGFLTEDGDLHLGRVGEMMKVLGTVEDRIFQMRKMQEDREKQRKQMLKNSLANNGRGTTPSQQQQGEDNPLLIKYSGNPQRGSGIAKRAIDVSVLPPTNVDLTQLTSLSGNSSVSEPLAKKLRPAADEASEEAVEKKVPPTKSENKSAAAALRERLNGGGGGGDSGAAKATKSNEIDESQSEKKAKVEVEAEEEEADFGDAKPKSALSTTSSEVENGVKEEDAEVDDDDEEDEEEEEEKFDPTLSYDDRVKALAKKRNEPAEDVEDLVKFGEAGWKERYYETKFGKEFATDPAKRRQVVESYVRGLCWVLQYYYKGCQSWKWYYEFHYAPFASDLVDLEGIDLNWAPSRPFKPFEQLMAVFPPQSAKALPEPCRWYMTSEDSEIADFYPREIQFDPNGKPVRWLWIALLPFIDEQRLLEVTKHIEEKLNTDEKRRNATMPDLIFVPKDAVGASAISSVLGKSPPNLLPNWESDQIAILKQKEQQQSKIFEDALHLPAPTTAGDVRGGGSDDIYLSAPEAGGISGFFLPAAPEFAVKVGDRVKSPFPSVLESVPESASFVCEFRLPPMLPHLSRLNPRVTIPPPVLTEQDLQIRRPKLSGMDVSTLLSSNQGNNEYNDGPGRHNWSGMERSWGSAEPERKFNYQSGGSHPNPFLNAPPPLLPGLTSRQQPPQGYGAGGPYRGTYDQSAYYQYSASTAGRGGAATNDNSTLLAQLQQTLWQHQQQSGSAPPPGQYGYYPPPTGGYPSGQYGYGAGYSGYPPQGYPAQDQRGYQYPPPPGAYGGSQQQQQHGNQYQNNPPYSQQHQRYQGGGRGDSSYQRDNYNRGGGSSYGSSNSYGGHNQGGYRDRRY